ncbi:MAG: Uma2 family endonuclease [Candidatus Sumerlaeota bacterium]|nr:Uma2 family endonuclease [Candidatus Sumerlaeota bacterium]
MAATMTIPAPAKRAMTAEEFWRLAQHSDYRGELIFGEEHPLAPAGFDHGRMLVELAALICAHVKKKRLGVVNSDVGYVLTRNPDTILAPDIAFVSKERLGQLGDPSRFSEIPPDLAIEIISPSDTYAATKDKAAIYLEAGVQEVWIVNPRRKTIEVMRPSQTIEIHRVGEFIETPLLPGFRLSLSEILD